MIYCCKSKLSLAGICFFEKGNLYEGYFDKKTNLYWMKVNHGGETPIENKMFEIHFDTLDRIRDKKLKQILK